MIGVTLFQPGEYARGKRAEWDWTDELHGFIGSPKTTLTKDAAGGFSLATFKGDRRKLENLELVYVLGLDFDKSPHTAEEIAGHFSRYACFVYSTFSHTYSVPRSRALFHLSRPVTAAEYALILPRFFHACAGIGLIADKQAKDASRYWYSPAVRHGEPYHFVQNKGRPADVEALLDSARKNAERERREQERRDAARKVIPFPKNAFERARRYIGKMDAAVSGQGGHLATFAVARKLVQDFGLTDHESWSLLLEYNQRCKPAWSEKELRHKLESAKSARVRNPMGCK